MRTPPLFSSLLLSAGLLFLPQADAEPAAAGDAPSPTLAAASTLRGDVNGDGQISAVDALAVLSATVDKPIPEGWSVRPNGDADCNSEITARDALILLSRSVGRDVSQFCVGTSLVASVEVSPSTATLAPGGSVQLGAVARDQGGNALSGARFTWTSSDTLVAAVDTAGRVYGRAAGTVAIIVFADDVADTAQVVVRTDSAAAAVALVVLPAADTLNALGDTLRLTAVGIAANGDTLRDPSGVVWATLDTVIALEPRGATALAISRRRGTAKVYAFYGDGLTDSASILIRQVPAFVDVTPARDTLSVGESRQFAATALDSNRVAIPGVPFTWSSSNTAVATVSTAGLVQARAEGSPTITAATAGATGTAMLVVNRAAARIFVNAGATGRNAGTSWADAYTELSRALNVAVPGQEVWVAAGTYTPTPHPDSADSRTATFPLKSGVAVYGGFAGTETALGMRDWQRNRTILSGDLSGNDNANVHPSEPTRSENAYHVVVSNLADSTAILDGFTVTGGNTTRGGGGGGIYATSSSATMANLVVIGNIAGSGGGVYNYNPGFNSPSPRFTNVEITGNRAGSGGGMFNNASRPRLNNVTLSGNTAVLDDGTCCSIGGGMYNFDSSPVLINVRVTGNTTTGAGGGIANLYRSSPQITNVEITGNAANNGGGIYNDNYIGGTLTNVTVSGNRARNLGGGIFNFNRVSTVVRNSIIWGNAAANGDDEISNVSQIFYYSLVKGRNPGDNGNLDGTVSTNDPQFVDAAGGNYRLRAGSPVIDQGFNPYVSGVATDLAGNRRLADGNGDGTAIVDLGAYEHQP